MNNCVLTTILCLTLAHLAPLLAQAQSLQKPRSSNSLIPALTAPKALKPSSPHKPWQKALGGTDAGGGDAYVEDFIRIATQEVLPLIARFGSHLNTAVSADDFQKQINPEILVSVPQVYESCDPDDMNESPIENDLNRGREVMGCYNDDTKMIYLSVKKYPLDLRGSLSKQLFIAHEIFRRMSIEGDQYEVSRQIPGLSDAGTMDPHMGGDESGNSVPGKKATEAYFRIIGGNEVVFASSINLQACDIRVRLNDQTKNLEVTFLNTSSGKISESCTNQNPRQVEFQCSFGMDNCKYVSAVADQPLFDSIEQRISISKNGLELFGVKLKDHLPVAFSITKAQIYLPLAR